MAECKGCGSFVSDDYARVFGDNDGVVHDCRHCPTSRGDDAEEDSDGPDDRVVLLREVRGSDADWSSGRTSSEEQSSGREQPGDSGTPGRAPPDQGATDRTADEGDPADRDGLGLDFRSLRSVFTTDRG